MDAEDAVEAKNAVQKLVFRKIKTHQVLNVSGFFPAHGVAVFVVGSTGHERIQAACNLFQR